MIHSFKFKNFYSFAEESHVDFIVNKNTPDTDGYIFSEMEEKISKFLCVIGNNASGKTTLLKVLPFIKWMIVDSFNSPPSSTLPIKSFMSEKQSHEPIELSVDFEIKANLYTYRYKLTEDKILEEELSVKSRSNERFSKRVLFFRKWDEKNERYEFEVNKFDLPKAFENAARKNASIISVGMRLNHELSQEISAYWAKVNSNVIEGGWVGDLHPMQGIEVIDALDFFSKPENEEVKKKAEKILRKFDLGLNSFSVSRNQRENQVSFVTQFIHNFQPHKQLAFQYESAGTKKLLVVLKNILDVLIKGGIALIDEFDVSLHPRITHELFKMFLSKEFNEHDAQLIFSTHNMSILNELDKYQVVLVDKGEDGISRALRLDEIKGVRSDDDLASKYMSGAYGAIPNIN